MSDFLSSLAQLQGTPENPEKPTDFLSQLNSLQSPEPNRSLTGNRISAGIDQYQAGLLGLGEAVAGKLGATGVEESFKERREQNESAAEAALRQARAQGGIESYKDVTGVGSALNYVGGLAAQSLPYIGESLVGGIGARALMGGTKAALRGAIETGDIAGQAAARSTLAKGSLLGGTAASYPSAVGDVLSNQRDQSGETNLGTAAALGVPYAALNAFGVEGALAKQQGFRVATDILDSVSGAKGAIARGITTGVGVGAQEAVSETAQEALNQVGRMSVDPNEKFLNERSKEAFLESAVGGFALGGLAGSVGGGMRRSQGSFLPGSTDSGSLDVSSKPDNNAINKAIDENSTDLEAKTAVSGPGSLSKWTDENLAATLDLQKSKGPNANQALVQQINDELARRGGAVQQQEQQAQLDQARTQAKQEAANVAQQQAQVQQQQAQEAFTQVAQTYGLKPGAQAGQFNVAGKILFTQNDAVNFLKSLDELNAGKTEEQKGIIGATLASGAVKVNADANPKTVNNAVNKFLTGFGLDSAVNKTEAAERANTIISTMEGGTTLKKAEPLNNFYRSVTGQDAPAFTFLVQQTEATKPTKTKGVQDGQLQVQDNAGLRAVSEQGGTTQTSGNQPGNVRPPSVQSIESGSVGAGSLGLQTGAIPSSGIPTSTNTGGSRINIPNAGAQAQGQVNEAQRAGSDQEGRGALSEQATERNRTPEQQAEETATTIVESVIKGVINAVVTRKGRMSKENLAKLKEFIYYDASQIEDQKNGLPGLSKKELSEMFDVSTDVIDGWQDISRNFFEQNRGVIQAQIYQALDKNGITLLELKEAVQAKRDTTLNDAIILEEGQRKEASTKDDEQADKTKAGKTVAAADQELTEVDESQLDQRDLGAEDSGMTVMTGRKGASVQEQNKPEETINAKYIRKSKELEKAENAGDEDLVDKLNKELNDLVDEAAAVAKKQVAKSEAIAGEKKKETKDAVQKRSPKGVSVRKQAEVSERVPSKDTEGGKTATESKAQTEEELAAQAWDRVAKRYPEAPLFADLTKEQQKDWISYGKENWTSDDVQTELVKLARTQFSKAGTTEGSTKADIEKDLAAFIGLGKSRVIKVVQSITDLPTRLQNALSDQEGVAGFVTKFGTAYLVADNIQKGNARAVFMHEVGSHLGLQNLLADTDIDVLVDQITNWSQNTKTLEGKIAVAAMKRVAAAKTSDAQYNTELIAYFIEEAINAGVNPTAGDYKTQLGRWFSKLVNAFRSALAKLDIKGSQLNAQDLVDLAYGAAHIALQENKAQIQKTGKTQFAFAGQKATQAAAKISDLVTARLMESQGLSDNEVWKTTGWYKGTDGQWRFEINDENAKLKNLSGENVDALSSIKPDSTYDWTLEEVLDFPELFAAYPDLAKVKVTRKGAFMDLFGAQQGSFDELKNKINITPYAKEPLSTLLHEVQHWIQAKEGFAPGGNEESIRPDNKESLTKAKRHVEEALDAKYAEKTGLTLKGVSAGVSELNLKIRKLEKISDAIDALLNVNEELSSLFKAWDNTKSVSGLYEFKIKQIAKQMETAQAKEWLKLSEERSQLYKDRNSADRVADQTKKKISALVETATKNSSDVQYVLYHLLSGEVEARDVQKRMGMTEEERKETTPGAVENVKKQNQIALKQSGISFSIASKAVDDFREQAKSNLDKIPSSIRGPFRAVHDALFNVKETALSVMLTIDVAKMASKYMPSAMDYFEVNNKRSAIEGAITEKLDKILVNAQDELTSADRVTVNRLIEDSTISGKWAFDPNIAGVTDKDIDPELAKRFNAIGNPKAKQVIRDVFKFWNQTLMQEQEAIRAEIDATFAERLANATETEKKAIEARKKDVLDKFSSILKAKANSPYAPLKRFGPFVVVAKSQEYIDAEKNLDSKWLKENQGDEKHYVVEFAETSSEAEAMYDSLKKLGYDFVEKPFKKSESKDVLYSSIDLYKAFTQLKKTISAEKAVSNTAESVDLYSKMNELVDELYLMSLSENSARKSELQRKGVAGLNRALNGTEARDMLRATFSQGAAKAKYIANLKTNDESLQTMVKMQKEAQSNRAEAYPYLNELIAREAQALQVRERSMLDGVNRLTGDWFLTFSPGFYFQQAAQTYVLSVPWLAGKVGGNYGKAFGAVTTAYKDIMPLVKGSKLREHLDFSKAPADVREMLENLVSRGAINIGIESELLSHRSVDENVVTSTYNKVTNKLRGGINRIEALNRASAATAAYRLEMAKSGSKEKATQAAFDVVKETHGLYDGSNTPRLFNKNAFTRSIFQFRRFQIIQLTTLARIMKDAVAGAGPLEKAIARKQFAFMIGHSLALAGVKGLPLYGLASLAYTLGKAAFGDDDDPKDFEAFLRTHGGLLLARGIPAFMGVDVSGKLGQGNVTSVLPYTDIDLTSRGGIEKLVIGMAGPFAGGLLPKMADGAGLILGGQFYKGLEQVLPNGFGGVMKGARFATEGITNRRGDLVMSPDEISFADSMMQALGLPTTKLSERQYLQGQLIKTDQFYNDKATEIKGSYTRAIKEGDTAASKEAQADWKSLQASRKENGYTVQPLSVLLKAPQEQKKRERNTVGGVAVTKSNKGFAQRTSEQT